MKCLLCGKPKGEGPTCEGCGEATFSQFGEIEVVPPPAPGSGVQVQVLLKKKGK